MTRTQRLGLAAVAVLILGLLAAVFGQQRAPASGASAGGAWLAGLKDGVGSITRIDLASATSRTTLRRDGEAWRVSERDAYPVDMARLSDMLEELAAARALEQKTSKPEFYARLGLDDIDKPGSSAIQIDILRDDKAPAWRVLIGSAAEGRKGRYVRVVGEDETWLVDRSPQAFADPADWIDRRILGIDFTRVASVTRSLADGSGFEAGRPDAGTPSLAVASLPAGTRPRYDSVFDAAARAVISAEAEDVRKPAETLFSGVTLARNRVRLLDGLILDIDAVKASDGNWIRVNASGPSAVAKDQPAAANPDPAAEVSAINQRLAGWAYKVSDYVYGELSKRLGEYTEPVKDDEGKTDD
jgi:hypothetical protein